MRLLRWWYSLWNMRWVSHRVRKGWGLTFSERRRVVLVLGCDCGVALAMDVGGGNGGGSFIELVELAAIDCICGSTCFGT